MDYRTKPISRKQIRMYAVIFRNIFGVGQTGCFPVLEALNKFPEIFPGSCYEIVEESELPDNVPARCMPIGPESFIIQISDKVYTGAYERNIGGYNAHILHEMCHAFLYAIGYTPLLDRTFRNGEIKPYESVEWQAKALCGEVMMPYEETNGMSIRQLVLKYGVSKEAAKNRLSIN